MGRAGATVPSANRITLVRDADSDGTPEVRTVFLSGLHSPFGMALVGEHLLRRRQRRLVAFPYQPGQTQITATPRKIADLPAGPINHHWTKNVIASPDGSKLYVTVGSNSNVGENGMEAEERRAAILEIDPRHRRQPRLRLGPAQPQRHGMATDERRACGPASTSATRSATTWSPTT
jgi:glucose/arabinose dehydrogenase